MIIPLQLHRHNSDDPELFLELISDIIVKDIIDPKPPYESSDLPEEESGE